MPRYFVTHLEGQDPITTLASNYYQSRLVADQRCADQDQRAIALGVTARYRVSAVEANPDPGLIR